MSSVCLPALLMKACVDASEQLVFEDARVLEGSHVEGLPVKGLVEPATDALLSDAKARQVCGGGLAKKGAEGEEQNLEKALSVLFNSGHLVDNSLDVSHEKPLCFDLVVWLQQLYQSFLFLVLRFAQVTATFAVRCVWSIVVDNG